MVISGFSIGSSQPMLSVSVLMSVQGVSLLFTDILFGDCNKIVIDYYN